MKGYSVRNHCNNPAYCTGIARHAMTSVQYRQHPPPPPHPSLRHFVLLYGCYCSVKLLTYLIDSGCHCHRRNRCHIPLQQALDHTLCLRPPRCTTDTIGVEKMNNSERRVLWGHATSFNLGASNERVHLTTQSLFFFCSSFVNFGNFRRRGIMTVR